MHIGRVFPEVERVKCTRFALAAPSGRTNESRGDNARSTREYAFFSGRGFVLLIVLLESLLFSLSGFTLETFNRKLNEQKKHLNMFSQYIPPSETLTALNEKGLIFFFTLKYYMECLGL